jgi:predicted nucleic acid-binding protein
VSASALLDTSVLISLVNANRRHHAVAVQYYRHLLSHRVPMYFSAVVAAEFAITQPVSELPLDNVRILNFNVPHGQRAAELWNVLGPRDGDPRHVVRDDVKLIAQASCEDIRFILTEDASTLFRYCDRLRKDGQTRVRAIKLVDGFDPDALREDEQRSFGSEFSEMNIQQ